MLTFFVFFNTFFGLFQKFLISVYQVSLPGIWEEKGEKVVISGGHEDRRRLSSHQPIFDPVKPASMKVALFVPIYHHINGNAFLAETYTWV